MRTPEQKADAVRATILEIGSHNVITDEIIMIACRNHGTPEKHIRRIGGWEYPNSFRGKRVYRKPPFGKEDVE